MPEVVELELGGRTLYLGTGGVARQASGAVMVRYEDTMVLITAVRSEEPRENVDFFPLLVDYEEKFYAAGKIPGGFIKREGRPRTKAVLSGRLIDRPIRPLFPDNYHYEVQIIATTLSVDQSNPPDVLAMVGASAALSISDIPFLGPIGAVRVGYVDGEFVVNPTFEQLEISDLDLIVAGTKKAINMVEAGAKEVSEDLLLEAMAFGHEQIIKVIEIQEELRQRCGKPKQEVPPEEIDEELETMVRERAMKYIKEAIVIPGKIERDQALKIIRENIQEDILSWMVEDDKDKDKQEEIRRDIKKIYEKLVKGELRRMILEENRRPDGRGLTDIRPITCEVGILPRTHGSAIFTRGETQALAVTTLGAVGDEQIIDGLEAEESRKFMLHYNFPPYSVGEVAFLRSPGRREIGHGALAERSIEPMLPDEGSFPYTIRLVSEILEANASSSMASVCAGTLALMDAGVPIKNPVAGISVGLIKEEDKIVILSDIMGMEDHMGDMDFKIAGTRKGVTALQMDIKIEGVSYEILREALFQAREGRFFILDKMIKVIDKPRPDLSPYAPRIVMMEIDRDKIREVIGPGGKIIRGIIEATGADIEIEDSGKIFIASTDESKAQRAIEMIESLTQDVEVGKTYLGTVTRIAKFGAFVEVLPGKEGLLHISRLSNRRVAKVEDVVEVGSKILVKVLDIDSQDRISLASADYSSRIEKGDRDRRR